LKILEDCLEAPAAVEVSKGLTELPVPAAAAAARADAAGTSLPVKRALEEVLAETLATVAPGALVALVEPAAAAAGRWN
jgi:hypothetical protein